MSGPVNSRQVVIVGGGRVGRHTAAELTNRHTVTIIEQDPDRCDRFPGYLAHRIIQGDGTEIETFERANPSLAGVIAGLTNDTQTNLAICRLAREFAPRARTLLRVARDGEQAYAHRSCVDGIVYPAAHGGERAVEWITDAARKHDLEQGEEVE